MPWRPCRRYSFFFREIELRDFAEGDIEVLFPNEVPRNFWLTPGITVVRLMPPMGRILDKHNGG